MFYLFLAAHLVADFILQPYWLVVRKRYWSGLIIHGGIVLVCMLLLPLLAPATLALWPTMLAITAIHIITDWSKVRYGHYIPGPPIVPFLLDQVVHIVTLAVALSIDLPSTYVWTFVETTAHGALIVSAYITAAFATPIGVMIWLDPAGTNPTLSTGTRVRSLLAGVSVVTVAWLGGIWALPVALVVIILIAQRPRSAHPLDMPLGQLAVICVGAVVGAVLVMMN